MSDHKNSNSRGGKFRKNEFKGDQSGKQFESKRPGGFKKRSSEQKSWKPKTSNRNEDTNKRYARADKGFDGSGRRRDGQGKRFDSGAKQERQSFKRSDRTNNKQSSYESRKLNNYSPDRPRTEAEFEAERIERKSSGREPYVPAEIQGTELDPNLRAELRPLSKDQMERVSRHLVACSLVLDTDPVQALEHAKWAAKFGGRVASVREIYGSLLYQAGEYREALRELRTALRMNAKVDLLPMIADAERGLGRPEKALEIAQLPEAKKLNNSETIELMLVVAGAYKDLGDLQTAIKTLETPALRHKVDGKWQVRMWLAYADLLAEAGREEEALKWVTLTADVDTEEITDAYLRLGRASRQKLDQSFETDEQIGVFDVEADFEEQLESSNETGDDFHSEPNANQLSNLKSTP